MKLLIISFIIAVVCTIYIGLFEIGSLNNSISFSQYLIDASPSDIIEIKLKRPDQEIILQKKNTTWHLFKPIKTKANQALIKGIVDNFPQLKKIFSVDKENQQALKEYGLDKPNLIVEVKAKGIDDKSEKIFQLTMGDLTPAKSEVYTQLKGDDKIYLLPATVIKALIKHWDYFRNTKLIEIDSSEIKNIKFKSQASSWEVQLNQLHWEFISPSSWRVDANAMRESLKLIDELNVTRFVENDLSKKAEYGLDSPSSEIIFTDQKNEKLTLFVGTSRAGKTYVQNTNENFIYSLDSATLYNALPTLYTLRTLQLFELKPHELVEISYKNKKENVLIEKDIKQKWYINKFPDSDQNALSKLTETICISIPEYFIDENELMAENAFSEEDVINVTIKNIKNQKENLIVGKKTDLWSIPSKLKLFKTEKDARAWAVTNMIDQSDIVQLNNQYYAKFNEYSQIFTINEDLVFLLNKPVVYFFSKKLSEIDLNAIYSIHKIHNGMEYTYQRFGSTNWEQIKPTQEKINFKKMTILIFTICHFEFEEWIQDNFSENDFRNYGLDNPKLILNATFDFSKIAPENKVKNGKFRFIVSHKKTGENFYCALYHSTNDEPLKLVPRLMAISNNTLIRMMQDPTK